MGFDKLGKRKFNLFQIYMTDTIAITLPRTRVQTTPTPLKLKTPIVIPPSSVAVSPVRVPEHLTKLYIKSPTRTPMAPAPMAPARAPATLIAPMAPAPVVTPATLITPTEIQPTKSILKTALSPKKSPARVEFGAPKLHYIPTRSALAAQMAQPLPVQISQEQKNNHYRVVTSSDMLVVGDPEELYQLFKQYSSWEQFVSSLTQETYQWTGGPNVSSLIIRKPRHGSYNVYDETDIHLR